MSLNKDMHARNPYKDKPPDFKALALEFPDFRKHCKMALNGSVYVNFQDDAAVRCLTQTLLKKDFDLEVDLPIGTLVPRVPQRLNYCLFIEDLLEINKMNLDVVGIDIGTGASCIFALLGARKFGWKFVATDGDERSIDVAHKNVSQNGLADQICVAHVDPSAKTVLMDLINEVGETKNFSFCMCNPPFFELCETDQKFCAEPSLGGKKYSNRVVLEERSAPHSTTFASSAELQVEGGEVKFVNRMIDDSILLRDRIGIYTSMLGRKQSIKPLKRRLERLGDDVKVTVSTLNQGKTQRWIIAWTFTPNIVLTVVDKPIILRVPKPGMIRIEEKMKLLDGITRKDNNNSITVECRKVTWTHQRAKRRAEARKEKWNLMETEPKKPRYDKYDVECQVDLGSGDGKDSLSDNGNFVGCERTCSGNSKNSDCAVQAYFPVPEESISIQGIRFRVTCTSSSSSDLEDSLNFELLSGPKHQLNQLIQFLRNSLCAKPKNV